MIEIFGYQIDKALLWTIAGVALTAIGIVVTLAIRVRLRKRDEERIHRIEKQVETANKNIENIEKHLGIPIYTDGLASADSPVFDPFLEGTKLMAEYKWDEAIAEFQKAMEEAKASQLVALFNLVGLCYDTSGRLSLALENYEESLRLARQLNDKQGEASALGNIGLIYKAKGDLDQALKYHQDALKIDREIGLREGEASDLGNIGLIYQIRGDLHQALKYQKDALKINKEIGVRQSEAGDLKNIAGVFEAKANLDQALKYYNEALKIFEEIGMQREIDQTKRNIERISQQMKK
jgi:tetratricopeptide (TPR) repeat protein